VFSKELVNQAHHLQLFSEADLILAEAGRRFLWLIE
jgi:hypothetical protein